MFCRGSGILLHISSLPSPYGIGDLGQNAFAFADKLAAGKQIYWQMLPLNPTDIGSCNSPYFSISCFAGNPLFISLELLQEEELISKTKELSPPLFPETKIDYKKVTEYKLKILEQAAEKFFNNCSENKKEKFYTFCKENSEWLDDYALFRVLKNHFNSEPWNLWPPQFKYRKSDDIKKFTEENFYDIEKEKFYQYLFFEQWFKLKEYCNKKSIKLIGDIPIYVSYDSVDVWKNPEIFKLDKELNPVAVSGVPPDYFSPTGQLWNNPVYNWKKLEEDGFGWWVKRIKTILSRFDIVRIDHFRGLVAYWEIPAGEKTAINGNWVPVPSYNFFDTIKREINNLSFIAEDLGFITEDVHQVLNHYGFPGMKVLLFAFGEDNPFHPYLPHNYNRNCVVYTGTHDNNTVRGWFEEEASEKEKERFFRYTGITKKTIDSVVKSFIRLAQSSVADISIIPVQDWLVLGSHCRMNKPSTAEGNWEWRMTEKQLQNLPVEEMAEMAETYGRISCFHS